MKTYFQNELTQIIAEVKTLFSQSPKENLEQIKTDFKEQPLVSSIAWALTAIVTWGIVFFFWGIMSAHAQYPQTQVYPTPYIISGKQSGTGSTARVTTTVNLATSTIEVKSDTSAANTQNYKERLYVFTDSYSRHGEQGDIVVSYTADIVTGSCSLGIILFDDSTTDTATNQPVRIETPATLTGTSTGQVTYSLTASTVTQADRYGAGFYVAPSGGSECDGTIWISSVTLNGYETFSYIGSPSTNSGDSGGSSGSSSVDTSGIEYLLGFLVGLLLVAFAYMVWKH